MVYSINMEKTTAMEMQKQVAQVYFSSAARAYRQVNFTTAEWQLPHTHSILWHLYSANLQMSTQFMQQSVLRSQFLSTNEKRVIC